MRKLKKYIPIIFVRVWRILFLKDLPLGSRIVFVVNVFISLLKNAILKKKSIRYFGKPFIYEYWSDPLTFLAYPHEISTAVLKQVKAKEIQQVLDIGGNVGQFSITLANMVNPQKIDVFEPNGNIIDTLKINVSNYDNIRIFNLGIGKRGKQNFYYQMGKSAIGSMIKKNAYQDIESLQKVEVKFTDDIAHTTGTSKYDLVKIDVEGYEYDVIKSLKGIKTKYMFIEISTNREKSFLSSEIFALIEKRLGKFDILWQEETNNKSVCYNVLLGFPKV